MNVAIDTKWVGHTAKGLTHCYSPHEARYDAWEDHTRVDFGSVATEG